MFLLVFTSCKEACDVLLVARRRVIIMITTEADNDKHIKCPDFKLNDILQIYEQDRLRK